MTEEANIPAAEEATFERMTALDDIDVKKRIEDCINRAVGNFNAAIKSADSAGAWVLEALRYGAKASSAIKELARTVRTLGNCRQTARLIQVAIILDKFGDATTSLICKADVPKLALQTAINQLEQLRRTLLSIIDGKQITRQDELKLAERILETA